MTPLRIVLGFRLASPDSAWLSLSGHSFPPPSWQLTVVRMHVVRAVLTASAITVRCFNHPSSPVLLKDQLHEVQARLCRISSCCFVS